METATSIKPLAGKSVFVVEDSVQVRGRLINWLETIKDVMVVGEAGTPVDAVIGLLRTRPDYVVLDFQLDGGTGADVLRAVRTQLPETVFVILTNHTEAPFQRVCREAGADVFFDKSTDLARVKDMIAQGRRRNEGEGKRP
jgi:DNA-binding NarL/FixJ family response regulator